MSVNIRRCGAACQPTGDNRAMHSLRSARQLVRIVLIWFALSLGVAMASPVVNPQVFELLCSGSGSMKVLVKAADGTPQPSTYALDCPLCVPAVAPPPAPFIPGICAQPLGHVVQSIPAARVAALTAAPLPARGPPSSLSIE